MAQADYIPAGRTSRIVKSTKEIQIQTEYAYRPNPRLTTSVISGGQVIHKIQQDLHSPIDTFEQKTKVESMLRKQHLEVIKVIQSKDYSDDITFKATKAAPPTTASVYESLAGINGVERVFRIDNEGCFLDPQVSEAFNKRFSAVLKNLHEVLNIFSELPGGKRESGLVEIEPRRLYFISSGYECYFMLTRRSITDAEVQPILQSAPRI
ncbi:MAG: hypothetical protein CVT49_02255 [candidate division Zixibacteria bacterium HGW-Zixibacteria-1]|nr:MAG: hypothetical protein CVT49_02255 [candidate division Zixibacteria bacterium HGW-Zixibacteria-1]